MDEFFDLPTLVVIGLAIVILFRLRSVLGTRTGNERPPLQRRKPTLAPERKSEDTVIPIRPRAAQPTADGDSERFQRKLSAEIEQFSHGSAEVAQGLKAIADADSSF